MFPTYKVKVGPTQDQFRTQYLSWLVRVCNCHTLVDDTVKSKMKDEDEQ